MLVYINIQIYKRSATWASRLVVSPSGSAIIYKHNLYVLMYNISSICMRSMNIIIFGSSCAMARAFLAVYEPTNGGRKWTEDDD